MATTIRTTTVTVNAAFLQEIKEVNAELWQLIERLREICRTAATVQADAGRLGAAALSPAQGGSASGPAEPAPRLPLG